MFKRIGYPPPIIHTTQPPPLDYLLPYFANQAGLHLSKDGHLQKGRGLPVYTGRVIIQRGGGIGDIFRSIYRFLQPLLESAAKSIGKEVLNTGASIASDVIGGSSFKESAKTRLKEAGGNLVNKILQRGRGYKRKRKRKSSRKRVKRRRITPDIFDG